MKGGQTMLPRSVRSDFGWGRVIGPLVSSSAGADDAIAGLVPFMHSIGPRVTYESSDAPESLCTHWQLGA